MVIEFYKCVDPPNKLEKTPTATVTLEGDFNSNVDVVRPSITCHGAYDFSSNYVHIPAFGRWYFLENVDLLSNKRFTVSLAVDVLQSFKEYLTPENVKCYDGFMRVDGDTQPFESKHIIFTTIEGVS